jgi:hypothetical protein
MRRVFLTGSTGSVNSFEVAHRRIRVRRSVLRFTPIGLQNASTGEAA